jgi:hypothetical protein
MPSGFLPWGPNRDRESRRVREREPDAWERIGDGRDKRSPLSAEGWVEKISSSIQAKIFLAFLKLSHKVISIHTWKLKTKN